MMGTSDGRCSAGVGLLLCTLALAGTTAAQLVAAPQGPTRSPPQAGKLPGVELEQARIVPTLSRRIDHPLPSNLGTFGDRVAMGDLNGDGHTDLAVTALYETVNGQFAGGSVYIMWGPDWIDFTVLQSPSPLFNQAYGCTVSIHDLDQDGIDDLIVPRPNGGNPDPAGHGFIEFFMGANPFPMSPTFEVEAFGIGFDAFAYGRQHEVGDWNGDTWPDLAVAVPHANVQGFIEAGHIEIFWGPGFQQESLIENPTPKNNDYFGSSLASADVTGDGIEDLIEGSGRSNTQGIFDTGVLHVFAGPALTLVQTIPNPLLQQGARFGEGLHAADLDGDGMAEVIASDVKDRAFILWSPGLLTVTTCPKPASHHVNPFGDTAFGYRIDSTDFNQDGVLDVVISDAFDGMKTYCEFGAEGMIFIALGPEYVQFEVVTSLTSECEDAFSWGLACGDVDGDGIEEIVAGAPTSNPSGVSNAGSVFVVRRTQGSF